MTTYQDLAGKVVLITGGATGIGASLVRAFHVQGARVFFCDLNRRAGQQLVTGLGEAVVFERVDLLEESQIERWIRGVACCVPTVHVLVNNAAADPRMPLEKTSSADWDRLFARNLRAFFLTSRAVVAHMRAGAAIVNFSSLTFHTGPAHMSAYVATKAGIQGLTRSLARELGPRGIRVNTLSPGWVMTERQVKEFVTPAVKRLIRRSQCVPDLLQPDDIASVALFLASESSRAVTGQEILADRGWAFS